MSTAFDLDSFAPADIKFKSRGVEYRVSGDPDVDLVARMLRVEEDLKAAKGTGRVNEVTREGKELIVELIHDRDRTQNVSGLRMGTIDVLTVLALIMQGGSVAAAVAKAVSQSDLDAGDDGEPVATAQNEPDEDVEGEPAAPLASALHSSRRSSGSDEETIGLLATGSV